jgi:hypothetical protein
MLCWSCATMSFWVGSGMLGILALLSALSSARRPRRTGLGLHGGERHPAKVSR